MEAQNATRNPDTAEAISWFAEGDGKSVEVAGISVTVRFVGRKGRRVRIAITAPPGARFVDEARRVSEQGSLASPVQE